MTGVGWGEGVGMGQVTTRNTVACCTGQRFLVTSCCFCIQME